MHIYMPSTLTLAKIQKSVTKSIRRKGTKKQRKKKQQWAPWWGHVTSILSEIMRIKTDPASKFNLFSLACGCCKICSRSSLISGASLPFTLQSRWSGVKNIDRSDQSRAILQKENGIKREVWKAQLSLSVFARGYFFPNRWLFCKRWNLRKNLLWSINNQNTNRVRKRCTYWRLQLEHI